MIRKIIMIGTLGISLVLTAYGNGSFKKQHKSFATITREEEKSEKQNFSEQATDKKEDRKIIVEVNGQIFHAQLYDNDTANAFKQMLPVTFVMNELNGNEKFIYTDQPLPAANENIETIQNGDIMLFGSDCLVVFYKSFKTSYTYTRIGHISDPNGLVDALGSGSVEMKFSLE